MRIHLQSRFAFVVMPFSDAFDAVYEDAIRVACDDVGVHCDRVDKQFFQDNIVDKVHERIGEADIVIADITGDNPNVMYEVGYARACKKTLILLNQGAESPFNVKQWQQLPYDTSDLDALKHRLMEVLQNPTQESSRPASVAPKEVQFCIMNALTGKALDVDLGKAADGLPLQQWRLHGQENQLWYLLPVSEKYYRLVSAVSEMCVSASGKAGGASVIQRPYNGSPSQHWMAERQPDGSHMLRNRETGMYIDARQGRHENGVPIVLNPKQLWGSQKWWLYPKVALD